MKFIYIAFCVLFFRGNQCAPGIIEYPENNEDVIPDEKTSSNDQGVLNTDDQNEHEIGSAGGIFVRQSSRKKEPIPIVSPDQGVWTVIKEDSPEPEIKNDNIVPEAGTGGGIFILESSRMKEFNLKLKPAASESDYQNKENDQKEDIPETGTGEGVFIKETKKEKEAAPSITDIKDVRDVGTGGGTFILDLPIPEQEDEIGSGGGVFIKDSKSIVGDQNSIKQSFPDLPEGIVPPKIPYGSNDVSNFNILRLNPADIAQVITSTVMKILAEINNNVNKYPVGITSWPDEFVGRANAVIDTKAKIAKRMVKEVGNFATGTIHNLDSLAAGANLMAVLNRN